MMSMSKENQNFILILSLEIGIKQQMKICLNIYYKVNAALKQQSLSFSTIHDA